MQRDTAYLQDLLESARLAIIYLDGVPRDAFLEDIRLQDAVIRRLEIVGEAARRLSEETRATTPEVPWADFIGMRNVLAHQYDDVDMGIVWSTVKQDLPDLLLAIKRAAGREEPPHP
ncbi:MAG: DUF86 domain-containing protein [Chloroflexota bacterium]